MDGTLAERFQLGTGSSYYLTRDDHQLVGEYLRGLEFLIPGEEVVGIDPAGEGNMNVTLRIITSRRRFILKQSRPWVARFPQLDAPVGRIKTEKAFQQAVADNHYLAGHMPEVLRADLDNYVLLFEDLGVVDDLSTIYATDGSLSRNQLGTLLVFAAKLHQQRVADFPDNRELKALNHAHVFDLPLRPDNGFPLDAIYPGLAAVARPFQHDTRLREAVAGLGEIYLERGNALIHGDYYPGSFLDVDGRVFVIDAEFAHLGRPEFDIGVLMAHLLMSRSSEKRILQIDTDYERGPDFEPELARRFCYVEVIRRLIGIAQLPVSLSLDERKQLLDQARARLI